MESNHLQKELSKWKKIAVSLSLFIIITVVGAVSFMLGKNSADGDQRYIQQDDSSHESILGSYEDSPLTPTPETEFTPKPTPSPAPLPSIRLRTITLDSEPGLDGFRSSNGSGSTSSNIRAGSDSELVTRFFVSFDISDISPDAEVISAELRIFQTKTMGEPYKLGGDLLIDHLNYGDSLDRTDYSTPALLSSFSVFSKKPSTGWRELDVTNQVINDVVSAHSLSQFRLHFEKEVVSDSENGDFAYFESGENTQRSGNTPELVIKYTR